MRGWLLLCSLAACGGDDAEIAPDADPSEPTAASIDFEAGDPIPSGAWLLANEWAGAPNTAFAIPADDLDAAPRVVFGANRVWSMGSRADGAEIYFSAWDAQQEEHFGVTIGDAIQNDFAYAPATGTVRALSWGNLNDECQEPSVDGAALYVCRRYDFDDGGGFSGWRAGRIDLDTGAFEFLRPDDPEGPYELNPMELPDGRVLLETRARPPATTNAIVVDGDVVATGVGRPVLAPDGHHLLVQDRGNQSRLALLDLDAPADPLEPVSPTLSAGDAAFSPDGDTIVYTVFDSALSCDHLERVTRSGGAWSAPTRVRDCTNSGEFITDINWIVVP